MPSSTPTSPIDFTVQAAGRYEDYSDFGSDLNWKLAGRFEPIDGFALRGSASTGFRAPSLQQQFLRRPGDQQRRRRAARHGDPAGRQSGRDGARRDAARSRKVGQPVSAAWSSRRAAAQRHRRRLPDRHRRPDRRHRKSDGDARCARQPCIAAADRCNSSAVDRDILNAAGFPTRQCGALLRQRRRHPHHGAWTSSPPTGFRRCSAAG